MVYLHCGHANTVHKWKQCAAVMDCGHGGVVPLPFFSFQRKVFIFGYFLSHTHISVVLADASVTVVNKSAGNQGLKRIQGLASIQILSLCSFLSYGITPSPTLKNKTKKNFALILF